MNDKDKIISVYNFEDVLNIIIYVCVSDLTTKNVAMSKKLDGCQSYKKKENNYSYNVFVIRTFKLTCTF